jgi:hypothetical protein
MPPSKRLSSLREAAGADMGTSSGSDPIKGNHPLLPRWIAQQELEKRPAGTQAGSDDLDSGTEPAKDAVNFGSLFTSSRRNISSAIRTLSAGGFGAGRRGRTPRSGSPEATARRQIRRAVAQYVGARGGAARTAQRLSVATNVGAHLFLVLDQIARAGLDAALKDLGVSLNERTVGALVDALVTLVRENGDEGLVGILDESMARAACIETFIEVYESEMSLTALTPDQVPLILRSFAVNAATLLVSREIGTSLVDKPRTEGEVREMQSTLRSVIESSIQIELPSTNSGQHTVRDVRDAILHAYENSFRILRAGR